MSSKGYFARIMGTMWRHRRTAPLSMGARGLWVTMMSFSADQMSDGLVEAHALEMIFRGKPDRKLVEELVSAEVIVRVHDGFQLRDWDQHNITKEKYETHLEKGKGRINKLRGKTAETVAKEVVTPPVTESVTRYKDVTNGQTNTFRSDQDQDQDQDRLERRERARVEDASHDTLRRTRSALVEVWAASGKSHDAGFASDAVMRRLADALPDIDALKAAATAYLKDEGEYVVKAGHPLALFSKQSARYVETKGPTVRANSTYQSRTVTGAELFAQGDR